MWRKKNTKEAREMWNCKTDDGLLLYNIFESFQNQRQSQTSLFR